jgi:hypothetical protein
VIAPRAALGVVADQDGLASIEPFGNLVGAPELSRRFAAEPIGSGVNPALAIRSPFRLGAAGAPGDVRHLGNLCGGVRVRQAEAHRLVAKVQVDFLARDHWARRRNWLAEIALEPIARALFVGCGDPHYEDAIAGCQIGAWGVENELHGDRSVVENSSILIPLLH